MMTKEEDFSGLFGHISGHLFPGTAIILYGLWDLFNVIRDKRTAVTSDDGQTTRVYVSRTWYPIGQRELPIEPFVRLLLAVCGVVAELFSCNWSVYNADPKDGVFIMTSMTNMGHVSMYAFFFVQTGIELLTFYRLLPSSKYAAHFASSLAFFGVGFLFFYHLEDHRSSLDIKAHQILYSICFATSITILMEAKSPHIYELGLLRSYLISVLGSWFYQLTFALYMPHHWSTTSLADSMFLPIVFTWHLLLWLMFIIGCFVIKGIVHRRQVTTIKSRSHHEDQIVLDSLLGSPT